MYKVSEAAELIGVEKIEIFEKLINHKSLLDPVIKKQDGVTYFDDHAIDVLKTLFFGSSHSPDSENEQAATKMGNHETPVEIKTVKMKSRFEKDREILYNKIEILKNELTNLDNELEMKDDMLKSYQKKILEDMESIHRLQYSIMKDMEKQVKNKHV